VDREIASGGRCGSAIETSDHRHVENERRQIERYNLRYLLGEEARLQVNARANASLAQLARLVERGHSE